MGLAAACQARYGLKQSGQGSEGSVGLGSRGSGGSVGMSDVGADVGVGCVDGVVGTAVVAAEAAGTGVGAAVIAGTGVLAGPAVISGDDTGVVGAGEACGRCVGASEGVGPGGCCDARTGAGERAGPAPDTPVREMSRGTMTRRPTMMPSVVPMMISRSCWTPLSFASKNATSRLHDPTRCALRLPPMIGPVKETTA